jgi:glycosyltransferase involved in cell wall biosynthesis
VYHHSVGVGEAIVAADHRVLLHTAEDAEDVGGDLPRCACMRWSRRPPSGVRQPITAAMFVLRTVPHLVRSTVDADIVHVQGQFGPLLTEWMMRRLRRAGRAIVWSPHNTFARSGKARHEASIRRMARLSRSTLAFSDSDASRLEGLGARVVRADLIMHFDEPDAASIARMRARLGGPPLALLAGQVRADKRPDLFVRACAAADVNAALVGTALDGGDLVEQARRTTGRPLVWIDDYVPLDDFVAALCAADVVVATHQVGSISGPLAIARDLGIRTVAAVVGGLAEQVTVAVEGDSAESFADAINRAMSMPAPAPAPARSSNAAIQHLEAYRLAGWSEEQ